MFLSLGITIFATAMIIFRIHQLSRDNVLGSDRYSFTIGVLAESGAMYAASLLVGSILLVVHGTVFTSAPGNISFWAGLTTPVAVRCSCILRFTAHSLILVAMCVILGDGSYTYRASYRYERS